MRLNVPANEWYGWEPEEIGFPESWDVREMRMAGHDAPALTREEIAEKLGSSVGTPPLHELARGKKSCAVIFDDMTRPTKTWQMLPAVLGELAKGGIDDDDIVFVMASGAHSGRMLFDFQKKLGAEVPERFLVFNHNPYENLEDLGETSRGTPVHVNREVMRYDQARFIFDKLGVDIDIKPCKTSDYASAAQRPLNSRFNCQKIQRLLSEPIKPCQGPLEEFLERL